MPSPLPHDPIAEARRQWAAHGWGQYADGMAAITSVIRAQQIFLARVEEVLKPLGLTFARYELLTLLHFTRTGALPMAKASARLQVHPTSDDATVAFSKHLSAEHSPTGRADTVLVVVNLDPWNTRAGTVEIDLAALGLPEQVTARDLLTHEEWTWGATAFVRLDPAERPAHVLALEAP